MTLLKTPTVELDEDFVYCGEVVKAEELANGKRRIIGVASGIEEDRDGERVSARAIAKMVTEGRELASKGALKLTSSHDQDWANEFGDVVALERDPDTDQLLIATELPPEGVDPLADKAWRAQTVEGKKLGFSVGGKLRKAFHERDDQTGKRRRVLDDIALRHVMLTEKPSYDRSFALAVAKSFTGDPPAEDAFTEAVDRDAERADAAAIVAKAAKPAPAKDDEPDPAAAAPAPPATPEDSPAAPPEDGAAPEKPEDAEPSDAELAADLPMARHLSCPNCGHEFAAELPDDLAVGDSAADTDPESGDQPTTKKSHTEPNRMSHTSVLEKIRELIEGSDIAKTTQEPPPPDPTAAAAASEDVLKSVQSIAQGVLATHDKLNELETKTAETFDAVGKAINGLVDALNARPQGRRSIARVIPPHGEDPTIAKTDGLVEDLDEAIGKTETPHAAFSEINKRMFPHHYANAA